MFLKNKQAAELDVMRDEAFQTQALRVQVHTRSQPANAYPLCDQTLMDVCVWLGLHPPLAVPGQGEEVASHHH